MKQTNNPDYRADEERVKTKINKTRHNYEIADEMIGKTDDDKLKKNLLKKNYRRKDAVNKMKKEINED
jgi:small acid-soluble spore protein (thioredoxin-like protein)